MSVRRRITSAAGAALAAALFTATPAVASTVSIGAPATAVAGKQISVVYSGLADAPGTSELTGTGQNMTLRVFYERNAPSCAPTSAAQRARPQSKFDGDQYVETPAPFSFTSNVTFDGDGAFRFCAYLELGQIADNSPPAAFADAVVQVGAAPIPCTVPKITGLSLVTATSRLKTAGCALGKVSRPKKVPKKAKLVVRSQSVEKDVRLATGFKINVVLKVKKKK